MVSGILISAWALASPALSADQPGIGQAGSTTSSGQLNWVRKGSLSERGTTQHNLSLATPLATGEVPASAAPTRAGNGQVTVLRWRTPGVAQTRAQSSDGSAPTKIVTLSGVPGSSHPVRQVSFTDLDLPAAIPDASADAYEDSAHEPQRVPQPPAPLPVEPAAQLLAQQPPAALHADATWQDDPAPAPKFCRAPVRIRRRASRSRRPRNRAIGFTTGVIVVRTNNGASTRAANGTSTPFPKSRSILPPACGPTS